MCLELVRTRAFAALLSDEVFSDVDLETVQVKRTVDVSIDGRVLPLIPVLCWPLQLSLVAQGKSDHCSVQCSLVCVCTTKEPNGLTAVVKYSHGREGEEPCLLISHAMRVEKKKRGNQWGYDGIIADTITIRSGTYQFNTVVVIIIITVYQGSTVLVRVAQEGPHGRQGTLHNTTLY